MTLSKIIFGKPGNLGELIEALRKEYLNERQVAIYKDFVYGKISLSAVVNSKKVFFPVYRTSLSKSSYESRQEEIEAKADEYKTRLEQEGFQVSCYWCSQNL